MDFTDALKAGGASATLIAIVGIIVKVVTSVCGHRCRSECCNKEITAGVKVESFRTPPKADRQVTLGASEPKQDVTIEVV
jgi:hypothetical protein